MQQPGWYWTFEEISPNAKIISTNAWPTNGQILHGYMGDTVKLNEIGRYKVVFHVGPNGSKAITCLEFVIPEAEFHPLILNAS